MRLTPYKLITITLCMLLAMPILTLFTISGIFYEITLDVEVLSWIILSLIILCVLIYLDLRNRVMLIVSLPIISFIALTGIRNYCTPLFATTWLVVITCFWPFLSLFTRRYRAFFILSTPVLAYSLALSLSLAIRYSVLDAGAIAVSILLRGMLALVIGQESQLSIAMVKGEVSSMYVISIILVPLYLAYCWDKSIPFSIKLNYIYKLMLLSSIITISCLMFSFYVFLAPQVLILASLMLICMLSVIAYKYVIAKSMGRAA